MCAHHYHMMHCTRFAHVFTHAVLALQSRVEQDRRVRRAARGCSSDAAATRQRLAAQGRELAALRANSQYMAGQLKERQAELERMRETRVAFERQRGQLELEASAGNWCARHCTAVLGMVLSS